MTSNCNGHITYISLPKVIMMMMMMMMMMMHWLMLSINVFCNTPFDTPSNTHSNDPLTLSLPLISFIPVSPNLSNSQHPTPSLPPSALQVTIAFSNNTMRLLFSRIRTCKVFIEDLSVIICDIGMRFSVRGQSWSRPYVVILCGWILHKVSDRPEAIHKYPPSLIQVLVLSTLIVVLVFVLVATFTLFPAVVESLSLLVVIS